jgi:hypothetical protein
MQKNCKLKSLVKESGDEDGPEPWLWILGHAMRLKTEIRDEEPLGGFSCQDRLLGQGILNCMSPIGILFAPVKTSDPLTAVA